MGSGMFIFVDGLISLKESVFVNAAVSIRVSILSNFRGKRQPKKDDLNEQ